jgi:hypothetical protein
MVTRVIKQTSQRLSSQVSPCDEPPPRPRTVLKKDFERGRSLPSGANVWMQKASDATNGSAKSTNTLEALYVGEDVQLG